MPLIPFPAALPVTDGETVAVWKEANGTLGTANDETPLGTARVLQGSACVPAAVDRGRLALDCGDGDFRLRDLTTDAETTPPGAQAIGADLAANFTANNGYLFTVNGLGSHLVGIRFSGKGGVSQLQYDLKTGARVEPPRSSRPRLLSLDTSTGVRPLCAPLRITSHRAQETYTGAIYRTADDFVFANGRLLIRHGGAMRLARCGARGYRTLGRSTVMQPILNGRYAAWASRTTVYVRGLRSGTTRSFAVRQDPNIPPRVAQLSGTEHRLWIQDALGVRVLDL